MTVLNIYLVHSSYLNGRVKYVNSTLDMLKKTCEAIGMQVNILSVLEPSKQYIDANIEAFNKRVDYEKDVGEVADEQFNGMIKSLNSFQISNIEKHRQAYKNMTNPDELHFIIEDDVVINTEYLSNIEGFFRLADSKDCDWDILFSCVASIDNSSKDIAVVNSRDQYKFLLSKSSYMIRPALAKRIYDHTEIFKHNLKTCLSRYIWMNTEIKSYVLNKHTLLEGSKMGIFPSSLCGNNFLYQNISFVNLVKISNSDEITDKMFEEANGIYAGVEKLDSPDFMHTMGIIHYKRKDYDGAKKFMVSACDSLQKNNGFISQSSDIINNALNMFQYDQSNLEKCKKKKSKYSAKD